jgi:glycosyltransferase involved in cell wall biosynthesis
VKVCLICVELFAWGKYGGYGSATRLLGRELQRRGVSVSAVIPRRGDQKPVEELDGITVLGFPVRAPWVARRLLRDCNADIYHSEHPSLATRLAIDAMPTRKHLITFRDPHALADWLIELRHPSTSRLRTLLSCVYESLGVRSAVRRADGLFCCNPDMEPRVRQVYGKVATLRTLPSPIAIPHRAMRKSPEPTVCFVGRWDPRKRPELFLETAARWPEVRFVAVGKAADARHDAALRRRYGGRRNLELTGFIDPFVSEALSNVFERSWVLMNTSSREGLPTSFLEALAHRCALLSAVDPAGVARRFGACVDDDDFDEGLRRLFRGDAWKEKGESGYQYVRDNHDLPHAVDQHLAAYAEVLSPLPRVV